MGLKSDSNIAIHLKRVDIRVPLKIDLISKRATTDIVQVGNLTLLLLYRMDIFYLNEIV